MCVCVCVFDRDGDDDCDGDDDGDDDGDGVCQTRIMLCCVGVAWWLVIWHVGVAGLRFIHVCCFSLLEVGWIEFGLRGAWVLMWFSW